MINKFIAEGWRISVLVPHDQYSEQLKKINGITLVELSTLQRDSTSPVSNIKLYHELTAKYSELKPDIVLHYTHKPNIFGSMAAAKLNIPNVSVITGLGYAFIKGGLLKLITTALYRRAAKRTTQFIFENQDDLALFQSNIIGSQKGLSIKGCGVDIKYYQSKHPIPQEGPTTFTFIGRLLTDKGIMEYLAAAKSAKQKYGDQVTFQVIGEVDQSNPASIQKTTLSQWINEGNIKYLGFQSDVRPSIEQSHCIILPSYREGMPRTMMESLAMSRPVITTKVPGCREIVEEGVNGYLVDARSGSSLYQAIEQFVQLGHQDRVNMGDEGRLRAEALFDDQKIAEEIFGIVEGSIVVD